MPEIDAVARLPNKSHDFVAENIFIKVSILVLDDEDSPKDVECFRPSLIIIDKSTAYNTQIDEAIQKFFEIKSNFIVVFCT